MIHLSGQKPADFGFERAQPNGTILFNTATLGFAKSDDRDAALAKWRPGVPRNRPRNRALIS